jgi:hypothetical protein
MSQQMNMDDKDGNSEEGNWDNNPRLGRKDQGKQYKSPRYSEVGDVADIQAPECEDRRSKRRSWRKEEDEILIREVKLGGATQWANIASCLPNRSGKMCRERWHNQLDPKINKRAWSKEEDLLIIQLQKTQGNRWAKITESLPGRTDNAVKNHWNASLKMQHMKENKVERAVAGHGKQPTPFLSSHSTPLAGSKTPPVAALTPVQAQSQVQTDATNPTASRIALSPRFNANSAPAQSPLPFITTTAQCPAQRRSVDNWLFDLCADEVVDATHTHATNQKAFIPIRAPKPIQTCQRRQEQVLSPVHKRQRQSSFTPTMFLA